MIRQVSLLTLERSATPDRVKALESALGDVASSISGVSHSHLGRHLPGSLMGDYTWDICFDGATPPTSEDLIADPVLAEFFDPSNPDAVVADVDAVRFEPQNLGVPEPGITDFVKRTLFVRVFDGTPADICEKFERDIMRMPTYVSTIRNWAFSRTDSALLPTKWTHVWEQEYDDVEGLQGEYMMSPFHWGYIDSWFDPECPQRIVDTRVAHVFCTAQASVLAWK
ncbi:Dabb family protein [Myxococcota bacterium]|nr:Dabb family protein [Myxococcota bacterium]